MRSCGDSGRFWNAAHPPSWCPCLQNPVPRGRPTITPMSSQSTNGRDVSPPRNSAVPVAPEEKTEPHRKPPAVPSMLSCAPHRAPSPQHSSYAVTSLHKVGPRAGNTCCPVPWPPCHVGPLTVCLATDTRLHKYLLLCFFPPLTWGQLRRP